MVEVGTVTRLRLVRIRDQAVCMVRPKQHVEHVVGGILEDELLDQGVYHASRPSEIRLTSNLALVMGVYVKLGMQDWPQSLRMTAVQVSP